MESEWFRLGPEPWISAKLGEAPLEHGPFRRNRLNRAHVR
jgi:hypothetical protein